MYKPPKEPISTARYFGGGIAIMAVLFVGAQFMGTNDGAKHQPVPTATSERYPVQGMNACTNALIDKFGGGADIERDYPHAIGDSGMWAFKGSLEIHGQIHRWQCNLRGSDLIQLNTERMR